MKTVHVNLAERSYDIVIGPGVLARLESALAGASRVMIVTDSHVAPLYGECVKNAIGAAVPASMETIPAGEPSKSFAVLESLLSAAVRDGLDRRSRLVALGGGVVGDLAGFMAACYMRGIPYIQIPTTLLAMVDSAVGGKTAVNIPEGKNLVGAFWQPSAVLADIETLKTLPPREYAAGMAEVIKYGIIWDAPFFNHLVDSVPAITTGDPAFLSGVVERCCEIKAAVVGMDEKEGGVRAILNFGHTLAHALEQSAGYGVWLHGEAVAVGMVYAARVAANVTGFPEADVDRLVTLIKAAGLPVSVRRGDFSWPAIRAAMASDKKSSASIPRFVLPRRLGDVVFGVEVDDRILKSCFEMIQA